MTHHLDPAAPTGGVGHDDVAGSPPKRPRLTTSTERVISFGNALTDPEIDEARWNRDLGKLYAIMVSCPAGTPPGVDFKDKNIDACLRQIRLLCGSRSPNTVAKRANSLAKYCLWHRGFYYRRHPIPICAEEVSEYVWEKHQDGVTLSALTGFIEAAHFAVHVLGLPLKSPNKPLVTAFTKGVLDKTSINRPEKRQARDLRVCEIVSLEELLKGSKADPFDRFAAGAFLFAIYGRCRWSDLKQVFQCEFDVDTSEGKVVGFLGFSTFSHKTAAQVARHGLPLPLVAPIWGLTRPPWALEWKKVADHVLLSFNDFSRGPLLPAPDKSGRWGRRSVTSDEASKWLLELLKMSTAEVDGISSHSLKATTLSWMAKAGSCPHHRTILGHHTSQRCSLETYSRDLLSAPLRTLEEVLRQVRTGALQPDKTRSGHVQKPTRPDCKDAQAEASDRKESSDAERSSSNSSSSSSSDSDSEVAEEDTRHWSSLGAADPSTVPASWGRRAMYQHEISKIVHVEADSETRTFKCGVKATAELSIINTTAFLDNGKCKRCLRVLDASGLSTSRENNA